MGWMNAGYTAELEHTVMLCPPLPPNTLGLTILRAARFISAVTFSLRPVGVFRGDWGRTGRGCMNNTKQTTHTELHITCVRLT